MSTIVTRAGKGSPLTNTEVDANFTNLNTDKVQENTTVTFTTLTANTLKASSGSPYIYSLDTDVADSELRIGCFGVGTAYRARGGASAFGSHQFTRFDGTDTHTVLTTNSSGDVLFHTEDGVVSTKYNASTGNFRIGANSNSASRLKVDGEISSTNLAVDDKVRIGVGGSAGTYAADLEFRNDNQREAFFTASCSGTTLTVETFQSGSPIVAGTILTGNNANIPANTFITALGTGTGGTGTYTISVPLTFSSIANLVTLSATENRIRFTSTDGFVEQGQPIGSIDFVSSDNTSSGTKAFIVAGHQEQAPSTYIAFGTNNNSDGPEAQEVARFDENGKLLIGSLTTNQTLDHIELRDTGEIRSASLATAEAAVTGTPAATDDSPLTVNRASNDGAVLSLQQDGVDQLKVYSTGGNRPIIVGEGDKGIKLTPDSIQPRTSTNAVLNGVMDLGNSTSRFKNLYLSDGVYLGGTSAANQLDDYEEGNWTCGISNVNGDWTSSSTVTGQYTKIGRMVHVSANLNNINNDNLVAGAIRITGLPFNIVANSAARGHGAVQTNYFQDSNAPSYYIQGVHNSNKIQVKYNRNDNTAISVNVSTLKDNDTSTIIFDLTYIVA